MTKFTVSLKKLDEANIAIFKSPGNQAQQLCSRYDLFTYDGGIGWGYKGSGPKNLSVALLAVYRRDITPTVGFSMTDSIRLLENLVSKLALEDEHDISAIDIEQALS